MIEARVLLGDVREQLRTLPAASVHSVVTSPPYWGLRDYGLPPLVWDGNQACEHEWGEGVIHAGQSGRRGETSRLQMQGERGASGVLAPASCSVTCSRCSAWRGSLGLEPTPELFVQHLVAVFREVRRVLRDDGTLWLNLGDSYTSGGRKTRDPGQSKIHPALENWTAGRAENPPGLKDKDLVGIPWLVAFALQADGWYLRSDIVWAKPNPMPESVTDRPTKAHELVFLLSKSATYYYDAEAVKERASENSHGALNGDPGRKARATGNHSGPLGLMPASGKRNLRSVWWIATQPYPEAHFSTFPEALVRPCILAGTSERGVCPSCGAPQERVVERVTAEDRSPAGWKMGPGSHADLTGRFDNREYDGKRRAEAPQAAGRRVLLNVKTARDAGGDHDNPFPSVRSLGWRPTCDHGGEPVPAIVLDPFAGSGTALLVAQSLGRSAIGVELNPEYVALAEKRLAQAVLL